MKLYIKLIVIWIIMWLPISYIFPSHPHYPSALLAPIMGFFMIFLPSSWNLNTFKGVILPFILFWVILLLILKLSVKNSDEN